MAQEDKNQRFPFSDKGTEDKPLRKGPKFSIYWIYLIIFAILIGSTWLKFPADTKRITEQEFKQNMLATGDVQKIDLITNKKVVRIYIKPESIGKDYYVKQL